MKLHFFKEDGFWGLKTGNNFDKIKKLYRNIDSKIINGVGGENLLIYEFDQQRPVNKDGEFIGSNYYHEIFKFGNGLAKVSKSFFLGDNETQIDTSIDEIEFTGTLRISNPKYGFIDKNGKEVVDCKYEWLDDFRNNKCPFELKIKGKRVTGFLDNEYNEHFD